MINSVPLIALILLKVKPVRMNAVLGEETPGVIRVIKSQVYYGHMWRNSEILLKQKGVWPRWAVARAAEEVKTFDLTSFTRNRCEYDTVKKKPTEYEVHIRWDFSTPLCIGSKQTCRPSATCFKPVSSEMSPCCTISQGALLSCSSLWLCCGSSIHKIIHHSQFFAFLKELFKEMNDADWCLVTCHEKTLFDFFSCALMS